MRNYCFRKTATLITVVLVMTVLCGCDLFASVDLTAEESGLVAEYAAGLLRKYDINGKLKKISDESEESAEEPVPEEATEEQADQEPDAEEIGLPVEDLSAGGNGTDEAQADSANDTEPDFFDITQGIDTNDTSDNTPDAGEQIAGSLNVAEILGTDNFDISYLGYELLERYPENSDDSWLMSMAAKDGKKLCVLKFAITNTSGNDAVCDILNSGKSYRLIVNGEKKINESVTVLMDSFSQFNESVASGDSKMAVLVFEPDNDVAESISSLKLVIKDPDTSDTVSLE